MFRNADLLFHDVPAQAWMLSKTTSLRSTYTLLSGLAFPARESSLGIASAMLYSSYTLKKVQQWNNSVKLQ